MNRSTCSETEIAPRTPPREAAVTYHAVGWFSAGLDARGSVGKQTILRAFAAVNDFAALNVDTVVRRSAAATRRDGDGGDDGVVRRRSVTELGWVSVLRSGMI